MRVIKAFLAAALLLGSYAANALPYYWEDWHTDLVKVERGNSYEYTHYLGGFNSSTDHVDYGRLQILLSDDQTDLPWWLGGDEQETSACHSGPTEPGHQVAGKEAGTEHGQHMQQNAGLRVGNRMAT